MQSRLQAKAESIGLTNQKDYYKKRLEFIRWARDERYTLKEIGEIFGITKEAVFKILKSNKFDMQEKNVVEQSPVDN